ncbi:MAG: DUF2628 domain-containing protein [Clostridia bacterium]|nr:DUF2628 domain-containing protein [Clostridia bacterium]
MSSQFPQKSCALCHAYLFPEDDVVYCPECGAPHHRECYNSIGKCALTQFHGTENQYDKIKQREPESQQPEKEEEQPNFETPFGAYSPIDFLGGVRPDSFIDDGVTAKQAATFVFSNTMRYILKFAKFQENKKISWNFMAFLFPSGWFLSRKMYKNGIIAAVFEIISTLLTIPFQNTLYNLGITGVIYNPEMVEKLSQNIDKIPPNVVYVALIGGIIALIVSLISALLGDWIYKKHTVKSIREIESSSEDKPLAYRKKGGVNIFMFLLGYMAIRYIPALIAAFI